MCSSIFGTIHSNGKPTKFLYLLEINYLPFSSHHLLLIAQLQVGHQNLLWSCWVFKLCWSQEGFVCLITATINKFMTTMLCHVMPCQVLSCKDITLSQFSYTSSKSYLVLPPFLCCSLSLSGRRGCYGWSTNGWEYAVDMSKHLKFLSLEKASDLTKIVVRLSKYVKHLKPPQASLSLCLHSLNRDKID